MEFLLNENYFTLLLLGGLLTLMLAYRDVPLPGTGNFRLIILILLLMCAATGAEHWALLSPQRVRMRIIVSVVHYVLQPFAVFLELLIFIPDKEKQRVPARFLLLLPLLINTVIYLAAPFAGTLVFWYDDNYFFRRGPLGLSVYIVTLFYLALLLLRTVRSYAENDRRRNIILFFITGIALLTGLMEGLNIVTGYIDKAFTFGIILYYIYLITVHEARLQAKLAAHERALSQNRVRLLREQIRPHFVFNSLQIIKSLIRTDQAKAVRCLEDFSDYLHANIDVIRSDKLISFSAELEHVRAYVSLALADESKHMEVRYDIREEHFNLPPLTIEPLVENALRHGISKAGGGTVVLSSRAEDGSYVITVSDNGDGFRDTGTDREKERIGIGIENVRTRLAILCNGTLDIESDRNGTVVTVRIPEGHAADAGETQISRDTDKRHDG